MHCPTNFRAGGKSILAYAIDQQDAAGHGPITEVMATMNVRLNIHHKLAITSEHEPIGTPSRPSDGYGPIVRAALVLVIFDTGEIVGPDPAGSGSRFTTRINAERTFCPGAFGSPGNYLAKRSSLYGQSARSQVI